MADQRHSEVLGGLPRSRPHRRSTKRPARPGEATAKPATGPAHQSGQTTETRPSQTTEIHQSGQTTETRPSKTAEIHQSGQTTKTRQRKTAGSSRPKAAAPSRTTSKPRAVGTARSGPRQVGRARPTAKSKAERLRQPPQPRGIPSQPRSPVPATPQRPELLGTFVQAAAELTEIGLSLGAQVLRRAASRLPRP